MGDSGLGPSLGQSQKIPDLPPRERLPGLQPGWTKTLWHTCARVAPQFQMPPSRTPQPGTLSEKPRPHPTPTELLGHSLLSPATPLAATHTTSAEPHRHSARDCAPEVDTMDGRGTSDRATASEPSLQGLCSAAPPPSSWVLPPRPPPCCPSVSTLRPPACLCPHPHRPGACFKLSLGLQGPLHPRPAASCQPQQVDRVPPAAACGSHSFHKH